MIITAHAVQCNAMHIKREVSYDPVVAGIARLDAKTAAPGRRIEELFRRYRMFSYQVFITKSDWTGVYSIFTLL